MICLDEIIATESNGLEAGVREVGESGEITTKM